jgi:hypothetical protein
MAAAATQRQPELAGHTVVVIGGSAGIGLEAPWARGADAGRRRFRQWGTASAAGLSADAWGQCSWARCPGWWFTLGG